VWFTVRQAQQWIQDVGYQAANDSGAKTAKDVPQSDDTNGYSNAIIHYSFASFHYQ
jgi:hypothetical protein